MTGQIIDRRITIGNQEENLSDARVLRCLEARHTFRGVSTREGTIVGLESVPVQMGNVTVAVDLSKATEIRLMPRALASDAFSVNYDVVATIEGKEVARLSGPLEIE